MKDISFIIETSEDDLDRIAASGTCQQLRGFFERKFWVGKKILPTWGHLKTALLRNDREMMRLLIIWGAKPGVRDLAALKEESPDDYEGRLKVLRQCGIALEVEKLQQAEEAAIMLRAMAEVEKTLGMKPGQLMPDGTIYLGKYAPKDRDGKSLGKIFNVFAAPEVLAGGARTYADTVKAVSELKDWHNYDGENYPTDKELYQALKNDRYDGGWIIPPCELLTGREILKGRCASGGIHQGKIIQPDNLYDHQLKGAFNDPRNKPAFRGYMDRHWYWSCTENRDDADYDTGCVFGVLMSVNCGGWQRKGECADLYTCRVMRLVEVRQSSPLSSVRRAPLPTPGYTSPSISVY